MTESTESASVMSVEEKSNKKRKKAPNYKANLLLAGCCVVYILLNLLASYIFILLEGQNDLVQQKASSKEFAIARETFMAENNHCISEESLEAFLHNVDKAINNGISVGNATNANVTIEGRWTLHNAFLLSFTIASTIGYGVLTPITTEGQLFCIFFAFISIPFTGLLAAKIGWVMAYYIKEIVGKTCASLSRTKIISVVFTLFIGLTVYVIVPTLIIYLVDNEEHWNLVECLYCVIITLTTIGFGDLVPNPDATGGFAATIAVLVWVVAGLAWLASIVNIIATTMTRQAQHLGKKVADASAPILKDTIDRLEMLKGSRSSSQAGSESFDENTNRSEEIHISRSDEEKHRRNSAVKAVDEGTQTEINMLGPSSVQAVILNNIEES